MPITNAQIAALPVYTSAEQLKMWKAASIELAANGFSRAINGRSLTKANASEVENMIIFWQQQVDAEAAGAAGYGNVLVKFGEAQ